MSSGSNCSISGCRFPAQDSGVVLSGAPELFSQRGAFPCGCSSRLSLAAPMPWLPQPSPEAVLAQGRAPGSVQSHLPECPDRRGGTWAGPGSPVPPVPGARPCAALPGPARPCSGAPGAAAAPGGWLEHPAGPGRVPEPRGRGRASTEPADANCSRPLLIAAG